MNKIKLVRQEKELIKSLLDINNKDIEIIEFENDSWLLFNSESEDFILDKLSDILVEKGLNENDEPNNIGITIENLIDKVSGSFD